MTGTSVLSSRPVNYLSRGSMLAGAGLLGAGFIIQHGRMKAAREILDLLNSEVIHYLPNSLGPADLKKAARAAVKTPKHAESYLSETKKILQTRQQVINTPAYFEQKLASKTFQLPRMSDQPSVQKYRSILLGTPEEIYAHPYVMTLRPGEGNFASAGLPSVAFWNEPGSSGTTGSYYQPVFKRAPGTLFAEKAPIRTWKFVDDTSAHIQQQFDRDASTLHGLLRKVASGDRNFVVHDEDGFKAMVTHFISDRGSPGYPTWQGGQLDDASREVLAGYLARTTPGTTATDFIEGASDTRLGAAANDYAKAVRPKWATFKEADDHIRNVISEVELERKALPGKFTRISQLEEKVAGMQKYAHLPTILKCVGGVLIVVGGAIVAFNTINNLRQTYAQDGNRIGARTRRGIADGGVDFLSMTLLPDPTGYSEELMKHYAHNGIDWLEEKGVFDSKPSRQNRPVYT